MPTSNWNDRYSMPYEYGADHYDDGLNNNLDSLATDVPDSGTLANRPDPAQDGAPDRYLATDRRVEYRNTGGTWEAMDPQYRLLSTFDSLQAAVDWSASNGTVFVDDVFRTDESGILLDVTAISFTGNFYNQNFPGPNGKPAIICTNTSDNDPLFTYNGSNRNFIFNNIRFFNEGNPRPFIHPAPNHSGFIGFATMWNNVLIQNFAATDAAPYVVSLRSAYGARFRNVYVRNKGRSTSYGGWHLDNCNACLFDTIASFGEYTADGETPCMYFVNCTGTQFISPYIEHIDTDAAIQVSNGNIFITNPYIELNENLPRNYHCGIQVGDGGMTSGHTGGSTENGAKVMISGGIIRGGHDSLEGIRVLNSKEITITGLVVWNANAGLTLVNYGGTNTTSVPNSEIDPGVVTVRGTNIKEIVNNSGLSNPDILLNHGETYASEFAVQNSLQKYEVGFVSNSTGGHSIVKKDDSGTIHVWDPTRTL